ncbi:MAG: hypothetical protein AAGC65_19995 [Mucilaginibacter sp.]|uniref:DUF6252 family protein n=1 Tax=Mucilaginibacter sp. TaxID=1882438 RepID=UPI0031B0767D
MVPTPIVSVNAVKNNKTWSAFSSELPVKDDIISIYAYSDRNEMGLEENLRISFKATDAGTYNLDGKRTIYFNTVGKDVGVSDYKMDSLFSNKATVINYDRTNNFITGTFNIRFIKTFDNPANTHPDTLRFSNGNFRVQIRN